MAGLLILAGAVLFLTKWFLAPYLFAVGAAGMAVCFLTLPTKDMEFRERRLHRFNIIASVLMICGEFSPSIWGNTPIAVGKHPH